MASGLLNHRCFSQATNPKDFFSFATLTTEFVRSKMLSNSQKTLRLIIPKDSQ